VSTVASRTFVSTPGRDAARTWTAIMDLLTRGQAGTARDELLSVSGIAASVIADQAPKKAAIVVTCDGPRTRIYCLYDDDAVEGTEANEEPLGFDPLRGDWHVSLPCTADDLAWVQRALKKHGDRVTARDLDSTRGSDEAYAEKAQALVLDAGGFLRT